MFLVFHVFYSQVEIPPYSPDLNPIERSGWTLKDKWLASDAKQFMRQQKPSENFGRPCHQKNAADI